jgi:hypothetical protein
MCVLRVQINSCLDMSLTVTAVQMVMHLHCAVFCNIYQLLVCVNISLAGLVGKRLYIHSVLTSR